MSENKSNQIETPKVKKEPVFSRRVNIAILMMTILYTGFNVWFYLSAGIPFSAFTGTMIGWLIRGFVIIWVVAFVLTRTWKVVEDLRVGVHKSEEERVK